jgi:hypothetical protein
MLRGRLPDGASPAVSDGVFTACDAGAGRSIGICVAGSDHNDGIRAAGCDHSDGGMYNTDDARIPRPHGEDTRRSVPLR